MASFFNNFPSVKYRGRYAPNILAAVRLEYDVLQTSEVYHPFLIAEGDRPDIVANLYYADPEADWLIYLANNYTDINNQWPLTSTQFAEMIDRTYGFSESSQVKHYVLKRNIPSLAQEQYDNIPNDMRKYWVWNQNTNVYDITDMYVTLSPQSFEALEARERVYWTPVTIYDYEFALNEQKRTIRLIDRRYKSTLEESLKAALNGR